MTLALSSSIAMLVVGVTFFVLSSNVDDQQPETKTTNITEGERENFEMLILKTAKLNNTDAEKKPVVEEIVHAIDTAKNTSEIVEKFDLPNKEIDALEVAEKIITDMTRPYPELLTDLNKLATDQSEDFKTKLGAALKAHGENYIQFVDESDKNAGQLSPEANEARKTFLTIMGDINATPVEKSRKWRQLLKEQHISEQIQDELKAANITDPKAVIEEFRHKSVQILNQ